MPQVRILSLRPFQKDAAKVMPHPFYLLYTLEEFIMNTKKITYTAVFTALVFVLTTFVQIPMPLGGGYINLGEAGIYICAGLCGPFAGAFAGGVGSALADLSTGYAFWALPTLIIKCCEGLIVGLFAKNAIRYFNGKTNIGMIIAGIFMILAYFGARFIVVSGNTLEASVVAAGMNVIQIAAGIICADFVFIALNRMHFKVKM